MIAYSCFPSEPPAGALFGSAGPGRRAPVGPDARRNGLEVALRQPGRARRRQRGARRLLPHRRAAPGDRRRGSSLPGPLRRRCAAARADATWLQVTKATAARPTRGRVVTEKRRPRLGLPRRRRQPGARQPRRRRLVGRGLLARVAPPTPTPSGSPRPGRGNAHARVSGSSGCLESRRARCVERRACGQLALRSGGRCSRRPSPASGRASRPYGPVSPLSERRR